MDFIIVCKDDPWTSYYGPFSTSMKAELWAQEQGLEKYTIIALTSPDDEEA